MESTTIRFGRIFVLLFATQIVPVAQANAESPRIQFDMPSMVPAQDIAPAGAAREVSLDLILSTLVSTSDASSSAQRPIDHLLVRCSLRDRLPIADYEPKTVLQSDYSGPISVVKKQEQSDTIGFSVDSVAHTIGRAHLGGDDTKKQSDATEYQQQAPMQAVVASGTFDRGKGVYFKYRWTTQQVLEGEKLLRVSFAVPEHWRGGLLDVEVIANGIDRSIFGNEKIRPLSQRRFVIATYQSHDSEAALIASRLAMLDQKLTEYAKTHPAKSDRGFTEIFRRILTDSSDQPRDWYEGVTHNKMDPYTHPTIQSLPMSARVAVIGYAKAARELKDLSDAGLSETGNLQ